MVRMWNVEPHLMCRQHLLGEHVEMHMATGSITKGKSVKGYTSNGLLDTSLIQARHDDLVEEMRSRNYNHKSPLYYTDSLHEGSVNVFLNGLELIERCASCRAIYRDELLKINEAII